ncbi:DNA-binding transcriptional regulator [Tardibacter chloracetimidivorans]|uniref:DNA-binding transcriptional regulator n=1 Tax=Tardibacter chloracetimidivorans TaxID=1921510 RepID=A0A1L3ZX75_9SPHN|nr:PLP-dependent aminotransferase family protein [Tardibacter chloracetimidivorans]API60237.1 DNA-binding transcriptional regulator [Tardibacter chloracetimidivorans]
MFPASLKAGSLSRLLGHWRGDGKSEAAYRLLARALQLLIMDGRVGLGVRLPGERELAQALGVSRTTLTAAYGQLRENGYLLSRRGSGSVTHLPGGRDSAVEADDGKEGDPLIDWTAAALPAPAGLWEAYEEALRRLPAWLSGIGYEAMGLTCLREAIARDYARRGCPTRPEQIIVTSGAQNGLTLVLRALTGPGDRVAVDHPTYHNALGAIVRNSCQPVPISLPEAGWDLDAMDAAFRQAGPRFAYLLPDFHNPTGRLMDEPTRRELVTLAARTRTPLLIDETMVETGLAATAPAPVAAHDPDGHMIISLGSASKRYWGGLRIGWIRASEQRIAEFGRLRAILDMATPVLEQLAVTVMLERDRRTDERRALMRARCDRLIALLADALPHWRAPVPEGGLALWAELPRPDASALAAMAQSLGLRIAPGPRFAIDGAFERFVRLPFTLSEPDLQRAVERLAQADRSLHRRAAHGLDSPVWTVEADRVI